MSAFLADVRTSFTREMKPLISGWVWLIFGLVQPLLYIGLFVPLLGDVGGSGVSPLQWFIPGMIVMLSLFGTAMVGWSLTEELMSGVLERFLATLPFIEERGAIPVGPNEQQKAMLLAAMERLGWLDGAERGELAGFGAKPVRNVAGAEVGRILVEPGFVKALG